MLVPIRVTIGLKTKKKRQVHAYPDFNSIRESVPSWDDGTDWSHYVDRYGGWKYDNVCGHADEDSANGSPRGKWLGILLVPADFAAAAVQAFPEQVEVLTESDCQDFYENRHTVNQPDINEDAETLQAIASKKTLGISDGSDVNALDPEHPQPGRRRNKLKTWAGYKQQRGVEIDAAAIQRLRHGA